MARTKKATTNPRSGLQIRRMILLDVLLLTTPRLNPNEVLCRALIHRSAWKVNSANFVLTAFSEVPQLLTWCSDALSALANIHLPKTGVSCPHYVARERRVREWDRYLPPS